MSDDPKIRQELNRILDKANTDVRSLTDADKSFLRARSAYLGKRTKDFLADVLKPADQRVVERRASHSRRSKDQAEKKSQQDQNAHLEQTAGGEEIG